MVNAFVQGTRFTKLKTHKRNEIKIGLSKPLIPFIPGVSDQIKRVSIEGLSSKQQKQPDGKNQ